MSTPPLPAPELIAAAQAGDRRAIDRLVRASMWIVTARVKRWPEAYDRDDLVQVALAGASVRSDTFGGVMRAIETYDPTRGANFWSHVTKCVDSALRRYVEHMRHPMLRAPCVDLSEAPAAPHNPEAETSARQRLWKLRGLPSRQLAVLVGWGEGKTFAEIGTELGISRESARKLAMEGREAQDAPLVLGRRNR